jgi:hypothetical protein
MVQNPCVYKWRKSGNILQRKPEAVYLPHNEPYLGRQALLTLDLAIPDAMRQNLAIARHTFEIAKSPLQEAVCELIPQTISIALSVRELIRQGYLFSAFILLRPMLERLALVVYLRDNPASVIDWHAGWKRKTQPSLNDLFDHLAVSNAGVGAIDATKQKEFASILHKVVHPDPASAMRNATTRDGIPAHASGKLIEAPEICDLCAELTHRCLLNAICVASSVFPAAR